MKEKLKACRIFINKFILANKKLSISITSILVIIILIVILRICFRDPKYGNTIGNANNQGIVAQNNKWIYYIEMDNNETVGICKVKQNGKNTKRIIDGKYMRIKCNRQLYLLHRRR